MLEFHDLLELDFKSILSTFCCNRIICVFLEGLHRCCVIVFTVVCILELCLRASCFYVSVCHDYIFYNCVWKIFWQYLMVLCWEFAQNVFPRINNKVVISKQEWPLRDVSLSRHGHQGSLSYLIQTALTFNEQSPRMDRFIPDSSPVNIRGPVGQRVLAAATNP